MADFGAEEVVDGRDLPAVLDADVHVRAEDHHLPPPVAGAFHELPVARRLGDRLVARVGEGVRASA